MERGRRHGVDQEPVRQRRVVRKPVDVDVDAPETVLGLLLEDLDAAHDREPILDLRLGDVVAIDEVVDPSAPDASDGLQVGNPHVLAVDQSSVGIERDRDHHFVFEERGPLYHFLDLNPKQGLGIRLSRNAQGRTQLFLQASSRHVFLSFSCPLAV